MKYMLNIKHDREKVNEAKGQKSVKVGKKNMWVFLILILNFSCTYFSVALKNLKKGGK